MNWMNPKSWVLGWIKGLATKAMSAECGKLRAEVKAAVAQRGPGAIDGVVDGVQARLIAAVRGAGPAWAWLMPLREQMAGVIQRYGDQLQGRLDAEVAAGGEQAVDAAFDAAETWLSKEIAAL